MGARERGSAERLDQSAGSMRTVVAQLPYGCAMGVQVPSERYLFMKVRDAHAPVGMHPHHLLATCAAAQQSSALIYPLPLLPLQLTYTDDTPDEYEPPMFGPAADGGVGCFSRMPFVMCVPAGCRRAGWVLWFLVCCAMPAGLSIPPSLLRSLSFQGGGQGGRQEHQGTPGFVSRLG